MNFIENVKTILLKTLHDLSIENTEEFGEYALIRSTCNGEQVLVPRDRAQVASGQTGATASTRVDRTQVSVARGHLVPILPLDHLPRMGRLHHLLGVRIRQLQAAVPVRKVADLPDQLGHFIGLHPGADRRYPRVEAMAIAEDTRFRSLRPQAEVHRAIVLVPVRCHD